ncbi:efflux RND transporter periplasmic adaptor subunit [Microcoleus sp. FACHB-831]|uniref:efflux RND transporter periplasmic adaptor subunit n=1 Tax=Microcoleus sp. FACHB-831 TaxID=2692827 RepID=UPI001686EE33|nr:efflux RND transporter periplasmic adaptor subunit [Microcoleus sp. FACHB-831]MBD1920178.1 efflux RND transporter periplasmic adaptor subunit [Microcoleus sp. FACHB-831]
MQLPNFFNGNSRTAARVAEPESAKTTPKSNPQKPPSPRKKGNNAYRWIIGLVAAGVLGVGSTTYYIKSRSTPQVEIDKLTVPVTSQTLSVRITASGSVVPIQSVNLSPKTSGRLAELRVEQSDKVRAGQIIGVMENREIKAQVRQAEANLAKAKAALADAQNGSRKEEIAQAQARLAQAEARLAQARTSRPEEISQSQARLAQAQARLAQAQAGRPEEIAQAQARLAQAEARLAQARQGRPEEISQAQAQVDDALGRVNQTQQRLKSYQTLLEKGAISQDQFNQVKTENTTAGAGLTQAQKRLELVKKGSRPEEIQALEAAAAEARSSLQQVKNGKPQEIDQLKAAVEEARSGLQQTQKGKRPEEIDQLEAAVVEARSALEQLKNGKSSEEIAQLKAAVDAAQAQLQAAQYQLEDTEIRAPFDGTVTQKYANVGAFVTPTTSASSTNSATSTSIVAIAKDLEIKAKVPEVNIGQIKPGQQVEIVADAYPEKVFKGTVRLVAPEAILDQNVTSFEVRLAIDTGKEQLRSGMNADLTFLGNQVNNALVVPTVAIVTEKGQTGVLIPDGKNEPKFKPIKIGSSIKDQTQILEGVTEGDRVFIDLPKNSKRNQPQNE